MNRNARLLIVDDDRRLRQLLNTYLSAQGFVVTAAADAEEARRHLKEERFDLMVLDVMMPGETGFEFISALQRVEDASLPLPPILMLTAMGEPDQRIFGLEQGADDYLVKPFEPKELLLRIQKIIQRQQPPAARTLITLGNLTFDYERAILSKGAEPQALTSAEASLLKFFAERKGQIVRRDSLAERLGVALSPRTVDVQVTRLRRKIEPDPKHPLYLKTVRHQGYVLWCD